MKKDCAFQYATADGVICEDTNLIDIVQALELWESYKDQFLVDFKEEREPEMAIWIDMKEEGDYHTTLKHVCASDMELKDGELFIVHQERF